MERPANPGRNKGALAERRSRSVSTAPVKRRIIDRLPDSFTLARSESEWLHTLLSADDLRYIFEGVTRDETKD